jgi:hypothetical protein
MSVCINIGRPSGSVVGIMAPDNLATGLPLQKDQFVDNSANSRRSCKACGQC